MNKTGAMVLDVWKGFTLDRRLEKRRAMLADSFNVEWRKRRGVRAFAAFFKAAEHKRYLIKRSAKHWIYRTLSRMFVKLAAYRQFKKRERAAFKKAMVFFQRKEMTKSWWAWKDWVHNAKYYKRILAEFIHRMEQAMMKRMFLGWNYVIDKRREFRFKIAQRVKNRALAMCFHVWAARMGPYREAKRRKKRKAERERAAAIRIQACWRGFAAREYAEDFRLTREWAVMEVQRFWRGYKYGKCAAYWARRHRFLREYIRAEKERDLMKVEDDISIIYTYEWNSTCLLQRVWRGYVDRCICQKLRAERQVKRAQEAKEVFQERIAVHALHQRQHLMEEEIKFEKAIEIQRLFRGMLGRMRYKEL